MSTSKILKILEERVVRAKEALDREERKLNLYCEKLKADKEETK